MRVRTIDNGGPASVNVYHRIVSVYGNVERLRFFVAFSLLSLLKAGLDSPAFTDPGAFLLPQSSRERGPCLLMSEGRLSGGVGAVAKIAEFLAGQRCGPAFLRDPKLFRSCKPMAFRQS